MKITHFSHSCLLIEAEGKKIIIDPGKFFVESHKIDEVSDVIAVLYTHEHPDHYNPDVANELKAKGVALYANESTARLIGEGCTVVHDGQEFEVAGMNIAVYELPHSPLPDGSEGPQNTGYVINGVLFHPGDGKYLAGLQVDNLALPIVGPDISMRDAFDFAKQVKAKVAIPIHYQFVPTDPDAYADFAKMMNMPFEMRVLHDGESTEI